PHSCGWLGVEKCGGFQSRQSPRLCLVRPKYVSNGNLVFIWTNVHRERCRTDFAHWLGAGGDGRPDWVVRRAGTGQTAIVYLNNNVVIGVDVGPSLPNGWVLAGVADFNGDGHPD